ncbi:fungal specific transcription factor domain-containing protein [Seiridium cupressi]
MGSVLGTVDIRLVPVLSVLYLISQLDWANIGNAKIEGIDKDLHLTGVQYDIALSLFFCGRFSDEQEHSHHWQGFKAVISNLRMWGQACILLYHFYWRMPFVAIPLGMIIVGYSIILYFKGDLPGHVGASMFAVIIARMGIYPVQPAGSFWAANNLAPSSRRAIGVAFLIANGNIGGIIDSYMFFARKLQAI